MLYFTIKKLLISICLYFLFSLSLYSEPWFEQTQYTYPYKKKGIFIQWDLSHIKNKYNFNVYRYSQHSPNQIKVNTYPIRIVENITQAIKNINIAKKIDSTLQYNTKYLSNIISFFNDKDNKKILNADIYTAFKTNPAYAIGLGLGLIDNSASIGETYIYELQIGRHPISTIKINYTFIDFSKYLIEKIDVKIKEKKQTSKATAEKPYIEISFNTLWNKKEVKGYNLYKKINNGQLKKMNKVPHMFNSKKAIFKDFDLKKKQEYTYFIEVVGFLDHLGPISKPSQAISLAIPLHDIKNFNIKIRKQDPYMARSLLHWTWQHQEVVQMYSLYKILEIDENERPILEHLVDLNIDKNYPLKKIQHETIVNMPSKYSYYLVALHKDGKQKTQTKPIEIVIPDIRRPAPVLNLKVQNLKGTNVLTWQKDHKTHKKALYIIYMTKGKIDAKNKQNKFKKFDFTYDTTYKHSNLQVGSEYHYYIGVKSSKDFLSEPSPIISSVNQPYKVPRKILNFNIGYNKSLHQICLQKPNINNQGIKNLLIYKKISTKSKFKKIITWDFQSLNKIYCHSNIQYGIHYDYAIALENRIGKSEISPIVSIRVPYPTPPIIKNITVNYIKTKGIYKVTWKLPPNYKKSYLLGYHLYTKTLNNKYYKKVNLKIIPNESFILTNINAFKKNFIYIIAVNKDKLESDPSIIVKIN